MLRVAVAGALGRMGRVACTALRTTPGITFAGGFARTRGEADGIVDDLNELLALNPDVLLDLTTQPSSHEIAMRAVAQGVRPVIGATGWSDAERDALRAAVEERGIGALLVPNFSIGAALMMRFAETAAKYFPSVEIVEMHHDQKKDAPSGTARLTAQRISAAGGSPDVPIHSVRLRGLLAHQEVLFGSDGEVLTIRHDALGREAYVPGIIAAVKAVVAVRGLVMGLDSVLRQAQDDRGLARDDR